MALRIALLGCGPLGRRYADVVTAHGSTVLVVFDSDHDAAVGMVEQTVARLAPSLSDAVTAVGVDAVVVCLEGGERSAAIDAAAAAGRPVFDATPAALDAFAGLRLASEAGIVVGVDVQRRHDVGVRSVIEASLDGHVGEVSSCSIVDRDESMDFEESLIHDLDLARHLTGSHIDRVAAFRNDRTTMVLLTHANGVVTNIENSQHAPAGSELRVELAGSSGVVSTEPPHRSGAVLATAAGQWRTHLGGEATDRRLAAQWVSFVDDVRRGAPTDCITDVGAARMAARAVALALAEGRPVEVAELLSAP